MDKQTVLTKKAPAPIGPFYSQGVKGGSHVYVSGQLPLDLSGNMPDDIEGQTRLCLDNVKAILEEAGSSLDKVAKVTVFITNWDEFQRMNEVYMRYFAKEPPARSCVEVSRLARDARVEIEAIAVL